ncbi:MAG: alpha/beta fold hydrolase [bacterium]
MRSQSALYAQRAGTVRSNGINLHYEMSGTGPTLILIEGLGVATWLWERQVPDFSKHFTTVVYDNRGVGKSDKPSGQYSISMMADDLAGLMEALAISKAHILGVSLGGFIAQDFALRYPDKVDRLVLVSTSAGGPDHVPMSPETFAMFLATDSDPRRLLRKKLALAYTESYLQNEDIDHLIDLRLENPQPQHAYHAQIAAGVSFNLSEQVEDITAPTLISAATKDLVVPILNAYNLHKKIPNSQLIIYEDLGHQFFVESPRRFNRDVIEFLTGSSQQKE